MYFSIWSTATRECHRRNEQNRVVSDVIIRFTDYMCVLLSEYSYPTVSRECGTYKTVLQYPVVVTLCTSIFRQESTPRYMLHSTDKHPVAVHHF